MADAGASSTRRLRPSCTSVRRCFITGQKGSCRIGVLEVCAGGGAHQGRSYHSIVGDNGYAYFLPSISFTVATTRSGSNPNFFCSSLSGADAPNVFMPMTRPASPTYRSHPKVEACSIGNARFDARRQNAVPVFLRLVLEDVPGRHRNHARADALGDQFLVRLRRRD